MRTVKLGEYKTAEDWDLTLNKKSLTPPKAKTNFISIPGRSGDLDASESLTGEVKYENRTLSLTFLLTEGSYSDRETVISTIIAAIHGKRLNIVLPDDEDHYLTGRLAITNRENVAGYGSITFEAICDPWFYANNNTVRTVTATSTAQTILLSNSGVKTAVPDITVTGSVNLTYGSNTVALSSGNYKLADLKLKTGNTTVTVSGSGTISFSYKEAIL